MTNTFAWPIEQCPRCQTRNTVELRADSRLCLACDHEYVPSTVTGPLVAVPATPIEREHLALVPPPITDEATDIAGQLTAARARFVGAQVVVHDLGEQGTLTAIDDNGIATVEFGSGFLVYVEPDEFSAVEVPEVIDAQPDDVQEALAATTTQVAAQLFQAARVAIDGDGDDRKLALPPNGWLPDVQGIMPIIEHGTAYAVAWLCLAFGITNEQLEQSATAFAEAAQAAKEATSQQ